MSRALCAVAELKPLWPSKASTGRQGPARGVPRSAGSEQSLCGQVAHSAHARCFNRRGRAEMARAGSEAMPERRAPNRFDRAELAMLCNKWAAVKGQRQRGSACLLYTSPSPRD
eukprot:13473814-Alexandrium_andersonii.AAC.1